MAETPKQRPPGQRPLDTDPLDTDSRRDPPEHRPLEETWDQGQRLPRRNMESGSQKESDIIQRPLQTE